MMATIGSACLILLPVRSRCRKSLGQSEVEPSLQQGGSVAIHREVASLLQCAGEANTSDLRSREARLQLLWSCTAKPKLFGAKLRENSLRLDFASGLRGKPCSPQTVNGSRGLQEAAPSHHSAALAVVVAAATMEG